MTLATSDIPRQEDEPLNEPWCGTASGYTDRGHRCWRCREAWALKCRGPNRRYREKNREALNAANRQRRLEKKAQQAEQAPGERLLSTGQAAEILGVPLATMYQWEAAGRLSPAERTSGGHRRYREADVLAAQAGGAE